MTSTLNDALHRIDLLETALRNLSAIADEIFEDCCLSKAQEQQMAEVQQLIKTSRVKATRKKAPRKKGKSCPAITKLLTF